MVEPEKPRDLAPSSVDYVVSVAKASLGVVPFVGSLLAEIAGTLIPNQRIDTHGSLIFLTVFNI
jgi:hypothetical protein